MTDYELLVRYGHSTPKASEIVLSAKRGDLWAIRWIEKIKSLAQANAQALSQVNAQANSKVLDIPAKKA